MDETSFDEKSLGWFEKAFRLLVSEDNVNMFKELWEVFDRMCYFFTS